MRVLITNSSFVISYAVLRALRPHADLVVATYRQPRPTNLACSKYIDRSYYLAIPADGWLKGPITEDNTPAEQSFINNLLQICAREGIDTVIPTSDVDIYITSKNRRIFEAQGLTLVAPDFEAFRIVSDKYMVTWAARVAGLACPLTMLPSDLAEAVVYGELLGYPLVAKSRFSAGSLGVRLVRNAHELVSVLQKMQLNHGMPLLQEYVPGNQEPSVNLVIHHNTGEVLLAYELDKIRYFSSSRSTCIRISPPTVERSLLVRLARLTGLRGIVAAQFKRDSRDGQLKLLEINPRWGSNVGIVSTMGLRNNFNPILLSVRAYQVEEIAQTNPVNEFPIGQYGATLVEDILALKTYAITRRNKDVTRSDNPPPALANLVMSYITTYLGGDISLDPLSTAIIDDFPLIVTTYPFMINALWQSAGKGEFIPGGLQ